MKNNTQLSHEDHQTSSKTFPLSIIANDLNSPLNVGSLFRLSDALGINKLYLCGDTPLPPNNKINKTSRSAEKYVAYEHHESATDLVERLKQSGSLIIALELTTSSIDLSSAEFTAAIKNRETETPAICLILGSENTGVSEALLALSDITVYIKMMGQNSSMNVISAASIAAYKLIGELDKN